MRLKVLVLVLTTLLLAATFVAISQTIAVSNQASKNSAASTKTEAKNSAASAESKKESNDPPTFSSFVLTASGQAYDAKNHKSVGVTLSLSGRIEGKVLKTITLHSKDGAVTVAGYGAFQADVSNGVLVTQKSFEHMMILLSPAYYGGSKAVWQLSGAPSGAQGSMIPIILNADTAVLPLEGHPELSDLHLEGTIQLS